MNKIRIIDLLNKIANGEEVPQKIKMNKIIFEYQGDDYLYKDKDKKEYWLFSAGYTDKFEWLGSALNTEIEILEEEKKIPEKINLKLDDWTTPTQCDIELSKKIDEIIDYLKSKGE